jgi:hypothetical protein
MSLDAIADELSRRILGLFQRGSDGRRPVSGSCERFQADPHFTDYILFHEYFHGDNGRGCGASHQTGWTGLVANNIGQLAKKRTQPLPSAQETVISRAATSSRYKNFHRSAEGSRRESQGAWGQNSEGFYFQP